jgi:hypothetical protein
MVEAVHALFHVKQPGRQAFWILNNETAAGGEGLDFARRNSLGRITLSPVTNFTATLSD